MRMDIPSVKIGFPEKDVDSILADIEEILHSGKLTQGDKVQEFEQEFALYIGTEYAVAVNSGTCSLEIILRYYNVKDKEVIVPTNSFVASANSVLFSGGIPVLADIRADTLCLDLEDVRRKMTAKTRAIMVVHLAGLPFPQMRSLLKICRDHDLILIEDAAQAHGAIWEGKKAGGTGDAGSFSFYATKVITTGEGGMITTNDEKLAKFARIVRNHGFDKDRVAHLGYNWRLSEIQAVLGIYQLKHIEEFIQKRNAVAEKYQRLLKGTEEINFINIPKDARHSYYKFPIILENGIDTTRIIGQMKQQYGIVLTPLYYPPIHLQPLYQSLGYKEGMLPVAERVLRQEVCLPMFVELSDKEIEYIVDSLKRCLKEQIL